MQDLNTWFKCRPCGNKWKCGLVAQTACGRHLKVTSVSGG